MSLAHCSLTVHRAFARLSSSNFLRKKDLPTGWTSGRFRKKKKRKKMNEARKGGMALLRSSPYGPSSVEVAFIALIRRYVSFMEDEYYDLKLSPADCLCFQFVSPKNSSRVAASSAYHPWPDTQSPSSIFGGYYVWTSGKGMRRLRASALWLENEWNRGITKTPLILSQELRNEWVSGRENERE